MTLKERYDAAKEVYKAIGVDTDVAMKALKAIPISMHCWQGDDVTGFDGAGALSGGIQTTGNYPGRARNPEELMADMDKTLSLIPGKHRINLHASYAIFEEGEWADRDQLEPKHFKKWVEFAKEKEIGIDFNPTLFSHANAENATLSSEDPKIRSFWIDHVKACIKISEYFATEQGNPCTMNIWIPDGFKDIPADRTSPRARLKDSLDQILSMEYDKTKVLVAVESKVFGIGMESCTIGSHEFYMNYASKNDILCLLDSGHYHPTEVVSDKISSMLLFFDKVALHVTRPVRWDSDHVVLFDDETKEIAKEIIRGGSERVLLALDFFDASINRVSAWVVGMRNMQKALLNALLLPNEKLAQLQNSRSFTELMMLQEELKLYPIGDVWNYFCEINGVPAKEDWFKEVATYEKEVLLNRK
ncbi:L-rhamnose isomerase [Lacrimispora sp.]|uniref:L-rhamnose isomerase n=1 Tax=Lacrimispora sp. TaxID=2719234 RepID=UPI0028B08F5F|nr:L-rhamnose isomerase [Lacrimispora sp.]